MKWLCGFFFVALTMGFATQAHAWGNLNDSEEPGSVLVFPKFIRGTFSDLFSAQAVAAKTEIELSVVCPNGATCTSGPGAPLVRLRAHWVCPTTCAETSFDLTTTVGGTLYFNPEGVTALGGVITAAAFPSNVTTPIPVPPCQRGYLIVWVVDGSGNPIKFDGLIGDTVLRSPIDDNVLHARGHNAFPIQADPALATGAETDLDINGNPTGTLQFDGSGSHYQEVTGKIYGTVRYEDLNPAATPPVQTFLTLLTLDVRSNLVNPVTTVGLDFFDPNEGMVDTATSFVCWEETRLTDINSGLTVQRMGRKGVVQSTSAVQQDSGGTIVSAAPSLLGIVETDELLVACGSGGTDPCRRSYTNWLLNDSNPVTTTYVP